MHDRFVRAAGILTRLYIPNISSYNPLALETLFMLHVLSPTFIRNE